ncbi:hypothetical protein GH714_031728 [Hevea brasiliensis]|uniref:Saccharopine dehydrogenase NADP binding domain-containing protein n=1 Tax=Hevea brasiliensis TaxID=3981 RepID=A0A6A6LFW2_HEVBR|nr:hypothetical protein GH714_031728 [Hevea brasiliensis]
MRFTTGIRCAGPRSAPKQGSGRPSVGSKVNRACGSNRWASQAQNEVHRQAWLAKTAGGHRPEAHAGARKIAGGPPRHETRFKHRWELLGAKCVQDMGESEWKQGLNGRESHRRSRDAQAGKVQICMGAGLARAASQPKRDQRQSPSPPYDVAILGASGFTGKYVVREALKFLNIPSSPLKSLALAGRKPTKITHALNWASHPQHSSSDPYPQSRHYYPFFHPSSLHPNQAHSQLRWTLLPLWCDYLDISGEPEFMERMEMKFHENAVETGSLVVSACGFDSVPAELGWMFNSRQWVSPAVPHQIEAYLSMESEKRIVLNFGTYESAILGVSTMEELQDLRLSRPKRARPAVS